MNTVTTMSSVNGSTPDQQFYVGQKALINKDGRILILHDSTLPEEISYDFPGGKIQKGETDFTKALLREITEETSLVVEVGKPFTTSYFEVPSNSTGPNAGKKIFIVVFECTYQSGEVVLSDEHNGYHWVGPNDFQKHFLKKTNIYEIIEKYFGV